MAKKIQIAKPKIEAFFDENSKKIYKYREIGELFSSSKQKWNLKTTESLRNFINFLTSNSNLSLVYLDFPHRNETRYVWGDFNIFQILMDIKSKSYFSHHTAAFFNNLTEQIPKNIYLNTEQPPKPTFSNNILEQRNIDIAFQNNQRITTNIAEYEDYRIYHLSGKKTDNLGVINVNIDDIGEVRVTNIERTLIDITVRPVYSGGVSEVAKAFENAKGSISINKIVAYLKNLKYTYPYHQSIGFYLEKAGYSENHIDLLNQFPIEYDFYLDYKIKEKEYDSKWKIYFPKGL